MQWRWMVVVQKLDKSIVESGGGEGKGYGFMSFLGAEGSVVALIT